MTYMIFKVVFLKLRQQAFKVRNVAVNYLVLSRIQNRLFTVSLPVQIQNRRRRLQRGFKIFALRYRLNQKRRGLRIAAVGCSEDLTIVFLEFLQK